MDAAADCAPAWRFCIILCDVGVHDKPHASFCVRSVGSGHLAEGKVMQWTVYTTLCHANMMKLAAGCQRKQHVKYLHCGNVDYALDIATSLSVCLSNLLGCSELSATTAAAVSAKRCVNFRSVDKWWKRRYPA
jgi:hypothetical protein